MSSKVVLVYTPTANVHPAADFVDNKQVKVCINNQVAPSAVSSSKLNMGYETLLDFLKSHPLQNAFYKTPSHVYPLLLAEWWYTCRTNSDSSVITGTYGNGAHCLSITKALISKIFELPESFNFVPIPSKQQARQILLQIGMDVPKGPVLLKNMSPTWKFIGSSILRCLGGKTGSTGEMNEFEYTILSTFITGDFIDYSDLYWNEFLKLVNNSSRIFNVPFVRFLSLFFEDIIGSNPYDLLSLSYPEMDISTVGPKMFGKGVLNDETPITAAMQQWIEHPYVAQPYNDDVVDAHSGDGTQGEFEDVEGGGGEPTKSQASTSDSVEVTVSDDTVVPSSNEDQGMTFSVSNSEDMDVDIPSIPDQSSPTKDVHEKELQSAPSQTNPIVLPDYVEKLPQFTPQISEAQVDILSMDQDVQETPSSAVVHSTESLLEFSVPMSTIYNQPEPRIANLEQHMSATTLTHVVSIEEGGPLLAPHTQSYVSLNMTTPIFTQTLPRVHISQDKFLHPLAQTVNVSVISQTGIQVSNPSVSKDREPFNQASCEGTPTIPTSLITTSQNPSEVLLTIKDVLMAINEMSNKFDNKLDRMQMDLNNNFSALKDMKELVQTLADDVKELKSRVNPVDVKKGEKSYVEGEISEDNNNQNMIISEESNPGTSDENMDEKHDNQDNNNDNNNDKLGDDKIMDDVGDRSDGSDGDDDNDDYPEGNAGRLRQIQTSEEIQTTEFQTTEIQTTDIQHAMTEGEQATQVLNVTPLQVLTVRDQEREAAYMSVVENIRRKESNLQSGVPQITSGSRGRRRKSMANPKRERSWNMKVPRTDKQRRLDFEYAARKIEEAVEEEDEDDELDDDISISGSDLDDFNPDDDDDDDAPLCNLLSRLQNQKGKSGKSTSPSKDQITQTEVQEVNEGTKRPIVTPEMIEAEKNPKKEEIKFTRYESELRSRESFRGDSRNLFKRFPDISQTIQKIEDSLGKAKYPALTKQEFKNKVAQAINEERGGLSQDLENELIREEANSLGLTVDEYIEMVKSRSEKYLSALSKQGDEELIECSDVREIVREIEQQKLDMLLAAELDRKEGIKKELLSNFRKSLYNMSIKSLDAIVSDEKTQIKITLHDNTQRIVGCEEIHKLGLVEWKSVAIWAKSLKNKIFRRKLKEEISFLIEYVHKAKLINDETYRRFCVSVNILKKNKSAGLAAESKSGDRLYPVPEGITFADRMYVQNRQVEGLCFKDVNGVECFQHQNNITNEPLSHCIALLKECEDASCLPFRKRLIRWLFNGVGIYKIKKTKGLENIADMLITEYQKHEGLSDENLIVSLKMKKKQYEDELKKKKI